LSRFEPVNRQERYTAPLKNSSCPAHHRVRTYSIIINHPPLDGYLYIIAEYVPNPNYI